MALRALAQAALAATALTLLAPASAALAATPPDTTNSLYCKVVIAQEIRVFYSPDGQGIYGYYTHGTHFYVDRTDAPYNRYHIPNYPSASGDAWVTSDSSYVQSSTQC